MRISNLWSRKFYLFYKTIKGGSPLYVSKCSCNRINNKSSIVREYSMNKGDKMLLRLNIK